MDIVPAGKARVMVAQNFGNTLQEGYGRDSAIDQQSGPLKPRLEQEPALETSLEDNPPLETSDAMEEDVGVGVNDDVSIGEGEEEQFSPKDKGRKTLTSYIFEKLQSYGYPGRRLQEFKSEFVKESVSPDGVKDIEVVIPDKQYPDERGFTDTIENEELKSISHEVNKMFGLNFNGADRAGGKWTIKFTSADLTDPAEEAMSRDNLDQVYGKPQKSTQEQKPEVQKPVARSASTLGEMIKNNKDDLINQLKGIGE